MNHLEEANSGSSEDAGGRTSDVGLNDLQTGVGEICPRCGREIVAGQPTRKMLTGAYQHDAC